MSEVNDVALARLREAFPPDAVGKLPKVTCPVCSAKDKQCDKHQRRVCRQCKAYVSTQHIHIDFVGHAHVTERLLEVDPTWNWEPLALTTSGLPAMDDNGGLWIRLHVGGHSRIGYGHANGKRGGDAVKECIGDAIRNAGMRFGMALSMWMKEAPEPVSDVPGRQVEQVKKQTPEERASELRGQIAAIGKTAGKNADQIADDFVAWSAGTEIHRASVALLVEYKDHLQTGGIS